jgi:hypothetical protein
LSTINQDQIFVHQYHGTSSNTDSSANPRKLSQQESGEGYNYHAYLHKLAKYTNCFGLPKAYIQIQKIPKPENTKKIDIHRVMTVPRQPNKTI